MKLKFVIDRKFDKRIAKELLFLKRYDKEDVRSVDSLYNKSKRVLKLTQKDYQKSWNKIDKQFFKFIEKITGYKWKFKEYKCAISVINPGYSGGGNSNKFLLWWKFNPYFIRRIVAHELIMHHYHNIYNKNYRNEKLSKGQIWALAEIASYTLTSLPKEVKKFWPWNTNYLGSYLPGTAYPELNKIRKKLKKTFLERKDFDDYIQKAIKLIRKYPKIGI